jgi:HEAT repeat protein
VIDAILMRVDTYDSPGQLDHIRRNLERIQELATNHYNRYSGRIRREAESPDLSVRRKLLMDLLVESGEEDGDAESKDGFCGTYSDQVPPLWDVAKRNPELVRELVQEPSLKYKAILLDRLAQNPTEADARVAQSVYRSNSSAVRASALAILVKFSLPGTDAIFLDAARDKSEVIRYGAIEGLADKPGKPFDVLLTLCEDSSDSVRGHAVEALPSETSAPVRETLVKMLKSPDADIRTLGCDTVGLRREILLLPELVKLLHDPVASVVTAATSALKDIETGP